jgi:transcriptional regulator with XRE-family HTH domain
MYGRMLRKLRESRGLSQAAVAKSVGISPAHLARLESGQRGLYLEDFVSIVEALGDKPGNLLPNDVGTIGHLKPLVDRLSALDATLLMHITAMVDRAIRLAHDAATTRVSPATKARVTRKPKTPPKTGVRRTRP